MEIERQCDMDSVDDVSQSITKCFEGYNGKFNSDLQHVILRINRKVDKLSKEIRNLKLVPQNKEN